MAGRLDGCTIAIPAAPGVEHVELTGPRAAVHEAGAAVQLLSVASGKPVAASCHAPWTLIEAGAVAARRLTSYPSLATDIRTPGEPGVDGEVVPHGNLITSRKPDDIPAFTAAILTTLD